MDRRNAIAIVIAHLKWRPDRWQRMIDQAHRVPGLLGKLENLPLLTEERSLVENSQIYAFSSGMQPIMHGGIAVFYLPW